MIYTRNDIVKLDRIDRLKLINAITGIKPANLIGTIDKEGTSNLAIFSSIVHLGSNPSLLGFIARPKTADFGHTYRNILESEYYTINHIHPEFIQKAHYTSVKFPQGVSEFERCGLTEEYIAEFAAPFVKQSNFKIGMRFIEAIDIKINGTILVIGEVEQVVLPDLAIVDGDIDLAAANAVGISGLNSYYSINKIGSFPHAKINEIPEF